MARKTKVVSLSVPTDVVREYDRMVKEERTSRSELFRRWVEARRIERDLAEYHAVQREIVAHVNKGRKKPYTEAEIERILAED